MEADYAVAQSDIVNAKAGLNNTLVSLKSNKGTITLNDVKVQQAQDDYDRNKNMFADQPLQRNNLMIAVMHCNRQTSR